MAVVLMGWEFGTGLGHVKRLLPIAEALREAGHQPVLALKDLFTAPDLVAERSAGNAGFTLLQAPYLHPSREPQTPNVPKPSFADVLKGTKYGDAALLSVMVEGWSGMLRTVAPRLVVSDFSPTLNLAARNVCPTVVVGNGYTVPPSGRRLPPMVPWETKLPVSSVMAENDILRAVNSVLKARHQPPLNFLSDLFSGTETFVCTIPEFDPYAAYRDRPPLPPFNVPTVQHYPPIESRPENSAFVYLPAQHPNLRAVLGALIELDVTCDAFIRDLPATLKSRFRSPRLRFHERPQPLGEILPRVRAAIHQGGPGMAYTALLAGTPHLVLPRRLERAVTAYGLKRLKTALVLPAKRNQSSKTVARSLKALLNNQEIWRAAQTAAEALASKRRNDPVTAVVDACLKLLR